MEEGITKVTIKFKDGHEVRGVTFMGIWEGMVHILERKGTRVIYSMSAVESITEEQGKASDEG